jgi:hypothetical protein
MSNLRTRKQPSLILLGRVGYIDQTTPLVDPFWHIILSWSTSTINYWTIIHLVNPPYCCSYKSFTHMPKPPKKSVYHLLCVVCYPLFLLMIVLLIVCCLACDHSFTLTFLSFPQSLIYCWLFMSQDLVSIACLVTKLWNFPLHFNGVFVMHITH